MITIILSIVALLVAGYALWLARDLNQRLNALPEQNRHQAAEPEQVTSDAEGWDEGWGPDGWK